MTGTDSIPTETNPLAVELRDLAKSFGSVAACRGVDLKVRLGRIHALIGENGAGKSTAMKMLYGLVAPDGGEILVHGQSQRWRGPRDASRAGIGMVHQHFMLAGRCSGLDNIILGAEPSGPTMALLPRWLRPLDRVAARARLEAIATENHFAVDLDAPVDTLPVGVQQRLEILKLLYRDARILILDEPTAVLTPPEVLQLFATLRRLKDRGCAIILITHKLKEVLSLADDITVMRRGEVVGSADPKVATEADLATLMVGRPLVPLRMGEGSASPRSGGASPVLELDHVTLGNGGEKPRLCDLTLTVRPGEIVGLAGVEGHGQSELIKLLTSPRSYWSQGLFAQRRAVLRASGQLRILGQDARSLSTADVRDLGVGLVPEDRHRDGLVLDFNLRSNYLLGQPRAAGLSRWGIVRDRALTAGFAAAAQAFDIRPPDPRAFARGLSGGNQQKLIMARELANQPRFLLCAQPTRGVDIGAIELIHQRILATRDAGCGVLLISSELDEIRALSDRILVLFEGRIVAEFARGEATETMLGRAMTGGTWTEETLRV